MPQEMTGSAPVSPKMTVARWLFNPFIRIAGPQALGIGLAVIVLSGLAAAAGGVRFDGLLDFHLGYATPFWVPVVEGLVNWSVIAGALRTGLAFDGTAAPRKPEPDHGGVGETMTLLAEVAPGGARTVRLVDVASTQALARWPLLPAALVCILPAVRRGNEEMIAPLLRRRGPGPTHDSARRGLDIGRCRRTGAATLRFGQRAVHRRDGLPESSFGVHRS